MSSQDKMSEMLEQGSAAAKLLQKYQVRVRIVGDLTQLPEGVRALSDELMRRTEAHQRHTLNVMLAYTAKVFLSLVFILVHCLVSPASQSHSHWTE